MRYHNLLAAGIAFASAAAAQFIFPESSSNLQVNQAVQIRWNKANLQEPLSINLVPAGQVIRQDVVLQQVAVNIGNVGLFQWSADQTISAFPKFAMVIVDARSQVVVSQKFAISGLTKQPNQQIDLGNNGGNAGGKKNNNNNNGNNNKNEKQKDKAKNNDNDKNGNSCDGGNQNDDKKKQQQNNNSNNNNNKGSSTLLPLPGLPPNGAPPVSLKPLPNAAESAPASKPAAAAPTPTAAESSASPAAPAAGNEASPTSKPAPAVAEPAPAAAPEQPKQPKPAAAEPVPTTAAASETVKQQPEPAQPASNGFTTLQPSADPASAPAKQVKAVVAAAVPESTLKAEAFAAGKYFREKTSTTTTSDVVFLTALGAQAGQDKTISTAITPVAPARLAASNGGGGGAEETQDSLAPEDAKPTVLSGEKSGAEKKVPGLALRLLGLVVVVVVAGVA
ncbi:hypothetical protein MY4824_005319 [Beauveria thailandica]